MFHFLFHILNRVLVYATLILVTDATIVNSMFLPYIWGAEDIVLFARMV